MAGETWAADTPVSRPEPLGERPSLMSFEGGFCFTTGGMAFDLDETQVEEVFTPTYAPMQSGS